MLAFGRPRAVLLAAGVLLVAAGTADDPSPARERTTAAARTTTTFESSTDATVPRTSTTATTTVAGDDDVTTTTTTEPGDASTTSTTRATTTTARGDQPASTTSTTAATTTSTAPPPCPTGEVVWTAGFSATSEGDDRWSIETSGTLQNNTGAAVEITSVTTSISVSDGTAEVRGRPEPRQLAAGGRGSFAGEAIAHSTTEPAYRSTSVSARWADESLRTRCPAPR